MSEFQAASRESRAKGPMFEALTGLFTNRLIGQTDSVHFIAASRIEAIYHIAEPFPEDWSYVPHRDFSIVFDV